MKKMKKIAALFCASCMVVTALAGCGKKETSQTAETGSAATTEKAAESGSGELIALITMDSIDQHWVTLNEGAQLRRQNSALPLHSSPRTPRRRTAD